MKKLLISSLTALAFLHPLTACEKAKPAADQLEMISREVLSTHKTIATFDGSIFKKCRGRTALCPNECGHTGDFATFSIVNYSDYKKPGKYGDPKQQKFSFMVSSVDEASLDKKITKAHRDFINKLKKGDKVVLEWTHFYTTKSSCGGFESKFTERIIAKLELVK